MTNCQEIYQTKSSNLIWNCFDIWNSGRKAENKVKMTETKSSNLSVNKKFSWNLPNQVQQLDFKLFCHMEFRSKSRKHSQNDGTQVQQLECEWKIVKKFTKPSPATWFEIVLIYGIHVEKPKTKSKWRNPSPATRVWITNSQETYQAKSSNLIWKCFDIWNSGQKAENRVEMTKPMSSNLSVKEKFKKCTKPSPATWFEIVLIYGVQVEKPKTQSKWRNPSPATWVWITNCQEIYQTKSSNLIWNCFDIWNSGRKAENKVKMTETKSSNLSVKKKFSRNLPNQVQQLDFKLFCHMEFRSKSRKHSQNDGTQVQQLECEWKIVKKFTKPSPATWFEIVLIYGIHVEKPKTKSKWRNPSPATRVWITNFQETYQAKSSNLIWKCFDIWNSGQKAENRVEMTEPKSSNLSVNEKWSRNLPDQVQQLDLKMFWYMEFMSKSRKQSQNDGTQVQQLECEWEIVKKFTRPSPATWFENVLIYGNHVGKPKTELKWRNPSPATWVWMRNCQEIYQTKSSNLIWKCFDT